MTNRMFPELSSISKSSPMYDPATDFNRYLQQYIKDRGGNLASEGVEKAEMIFEKDLEGLKEKMEFQMKNEDQIGKLILAKDLQAVNEMIEDVQGRIQELQTEQGTAIDLKGFTKANVSNSDKLALKAMLDGQQPQNAKEKLRRAQMKSAMDKKQRSSRLGR